MENIETRTVSKRDSATAILRKLGIDSHDYNRFIEKARNSSGHVFCVNITAAKNHLSGSSEQHDDVQPAVQPVANGAEAIKTNGNAPTASSVIRKLIHDGLSNAEIWAIVQPQFKLDDKKRGYPAWYRSDMRRNGKIA